MGPKSRWVAAVSTVAFAWLATPGGSSGRSVEFRPGDLAPPRTVLTAGVQVAQAAGETRGNAIQFLEAGAKYLFPSIGADAPAWAKRIEFEWHLQDDLKPEFSLLTVQPLFRPTERDTFFTQLSVRRYEMFGVHRVATNTGLGYRRLLLDNTALLGINAFFDYD